MKITGNVKGTLIPLVRFLIGQKVFTIAISLSRSLTLQNNRFAHKIQMKSKPPTPQSSHCGDSMVAERPGLGNSHNFEGGGPTSQAETLLTTVWIMTEEANIRVVADKNDLIQDLRKLRGLSEEYEAFLKLEAGGEGWKDDALAMIQGHHRTLTESRLSLKTIDLVSAILRELLHRLKADQFSLNVEAVTEPAHHADGDEEVVQRLMSQLNVLAQNVPLAMQEKIRFLLVGIRNLFQSLQLEDEDAIEGAVTQINILTSSRESQNLVREIALIARDIYNTLNTLSEDISIEVLSESTEGVSDAVMKLKTVVEKLEEAATTNLDQLELLNTKAREDEEICDRLLAGLRSSQQVLGELKQENPDQASELSEVQEMLGDTIGANVMELKARAMANTDTFLSLIANQGFQDLTGQTLKKTIHFIEGLEVQLVLVLQKYRPVFGLSGGQSTSDKETSGKIDKPQSQDEVDSLLADLGF